MDAKRKLATKPPAVSWPKNLWLDTYCQAVTMTSMHAVAAPRRLAAKRYRQLGDSVPDRIADADQQKAAR